MGLASSIRWLAASAMLTCACTPPVEDVPEPPGIRTLLEQVRPPIPVFPFAPSEKDLQHFTGCYSVEVRYDTRWPHAWPLRFDLELSRERVDGELAVITPLRSLFGPYWKFTSATEVRVTWAGFDTAYLLVISKTPDGLAAKAGYRGPTGEITLVPVESISSGPCERR